MGNYFYYPEQPEAYGKAIEAKDLSLKEMLKDTVILNEVPENEKKYSEVIKPPKYIKRKKRRRKGGYKKS